MAQRGDQPPVALCVGKDCRNHKGFGPLRDMLEVNADVTRVKCLDHCDSPVVVLDPTSRRPIVLEKVRSKQHRRALEDMLRKGSDLPAALADRVLKGKKQQKVLRRLRRHLHPVND